jgi:flagellar biosynthesis component FlhA
MVVAWVASEDEEKISERLCRSDFGANEAITVASGVFLIMGSVPDMPKFA